MIRYFYSTFYRCIIRVGLEKNEESVSNQIDQLYHYEDDTWRWYRSGIYFAYETRKDWIPTEEDLQRIIEANLHE